MKKFLILLAVAMMFSIGNANAEEAKECKIHPDNTKETWTLLEGDCQDGFAHGEGIAEGSKRTTYEGNFNKGWMEGFGTYRYVSGYSYTGEFKKNMYNGHGKAIASAGIVIIVYEGSWKNDKYHGHGVYSDSKGLKYVGEWKAGKKHGGGTYTRSNGQKYVGEWKAGKRNGQGTETWPDGTKYVGEWKAGKFDGQGTYTWASGTKYVGQWKDNKSHGQGTYTWASGGEYVGEWKDDKRHGQGKMKYSDGKIYEGEWVDGARHGQGKLVYADGRVFEGEFRYDEEHRAKEESKPTQADAMTASVMALAMMGAMSKEQHPPPRSKITLEPEETRRFLRSSEYKEAIVRSINKKFSALPNSNASVKKLLEILIAYRRYRNEFGDEKRVKLIIRKMENALYFYNDPETELPVGFTGPRGSFKKYGAFAKLGEPVLVMDAFVKDPDDRFEYSTGGFFSSPMVVQIMALGTVTDFKAGVAGKAIPRCKGFKLTRKIPDNIMMPSAKEIERLSQQLNNDRYGSSEEQILIALGVWALQAGAVAVLAGAVIKSNSEGGSTTYTNTTSSPQTTKRTQKKTGCPKDFPTREDLGKFISNSHYSFTCPNGNKRSIQESEVSGKWAHDVGGLIPATWSDTRKAAARVACKCSGW